MAIKRLSSRIGYRVEGNRHGSDALRICLEVFEGVRVQRGRKTWDLGRDEEEKTAFRREHKGETNDRWSSEWDGRSGRKLIETNQAQRKGGGQGQRRTERYVEASPGGDGQAAREQRGGTL